MFKEEGPAINDHHHHRWLEMVALPLLRLLPYYSTLVTAYNNHVTPVIHFYDGKLSNKHKYWPVLMKTWSMIIFISRIFRLWFLFAKRMAERRIGMGQARDTILMTVIQSLLNILFEFQYTPVPAIEIHLGRDLFTFK